MAITIEELKKEWKNKTSEKYDRVHRILVSYGFELTSEGSSHFVYRHPLLAEAYKLNPHFFRKDFAPDGSLSIPKKEKKVKKWYFKMIIEALEIVEEFREIKEKEQGKKEGQ